MGFLTAAASSRLSRSTLCCVLAVRDLTLNLGDGFERHTVFQEGPDVASAIGFMDGNRNAGMHRLQLPVVVEGLSPDIARPGKADLTARARQRCRAKSNRNGVTVRPKHDVAGFDDDASIGFGSRRHRRVEIDFLAPRSSGRLYGKSSPDPFGCRSVQSSRADGHSAGPDHDLSPAASIPLNTHEKRRAAAARAQCLIERSRVQGLRGIAREANASK